MSTLTFGTNHMLPTDSQQIVRYLENHSSAKICSQPLGVCFPVFGPVTLKYYDSAWS